MPPSRSRGHYDNHAYFACSPRPLARCSHAGVRGANLASHSHTPNQLWLLLPIQRPLLRRKFKAPRYSNESWHHQSASKIHITFAFSEIGKKLWLIHFWSCSWKAPKNCSLLYFAPKVELNLGSPCPYPFGFRTWVFTAVISSSFVWHSLTAAAKPGREKAAVCRALPNSLASTELLPKRVSSYALELYLPAACRNKDRTNHLAHLMQLTCKVRMLLWEAFWRHCSHQCAMKRQGPAHRSRQELQALCPFLKKDPLAT